MTDALAARSTTSRGDALPTGTVTFLFTDIEGSTQLLHRLGGDYPQVLEEHRALIRQSVAAAGGFEFGSEGDALFAVFPSATKAVAAAAEAQRALAAHAWPEGGTLRVRMGLHSGEGTLSAGSYVGLDVHRAARVAAAAHGGQILISGPTRDRVRHSLPAGVGLRDLGPHRLKDIPEPEALHQLDVDGLQTEFPPPRAIDTRPNNLPPRLTSFVGRGEELAQLSELLSRSRLVTLTGPGGTGKTSLALRAASDAMGSFEDGAYFVALAPITDPSLVPSTVANALGVQEAGDRPILDVVKDELRPKERLLVLDNFEQVVTAAPVVSDLLGAAPRVRALVTSREALHVSGEQELPVPPLRLPDLDRLPDTDQLADTEAVALFVHRARQVDPDFDLTPENARHIAEISVRLDGLPLAIELAAARVKVLAPAALLPQLDHRLAFLRGGSRDLPARQQTLRGAIAWSYDLLDEPERTVFRRLGVFVGGCSLGAAEAVIDPDGETGMLPFDGLASLVDKSLLRRSVTDLAEPRFWMLETIREFAAEQLAASGEHPDVAARHAAFFTKLAVEAQPHLETADAPGWLDTLERDHNNLRAALSWCVERGEASTALRAGGALWRFWHLRSHIQEGRDWLTDILAMPGADRRTAERAGALAGLAGLAYWQTDYEACRRSYSDALDIYRELGDRAGMAGVLYGLGFVVAILGDLDASDDAYAESSRLYAEMGDRAGEGAAVHAWAGIDLLRKDWAQARLRNQRGLALLRETGQDWVVANALQITGRIELEAGDLDAAGAAYREALDIFERIDNASGMAMVLGGIAAMLIVEGRTEDGVRLGAAAHGWEDAIGGRAPDLLRAFEDARELAADRLPEDRIQALWREGERIAPERALAEGRQAVSSSSAEPA